MKRFIIIALIAALSFSAVFVVLDAIFNGLRPFMFYFAAALVFGLFSGAVDYLKEKRKKKEDS